MDFGYKIKVWDKRGHLTYGPLLSAFSTGLYRLGFAMSVLFREASVGDLEDVVDVVPKKGSHCALSGWECGLLWI